MPEEGERTDRTAPFHLLLGTDLAMFGMRSLPIVGREAEQQIALNTLATVREMPAPHRCGGGSRGTGKSHLANGSPAGATRWRIHPGSSRVRSESTWATPWSTSSTRCRHNWTQPHRGEGAG